MSDGADRDTAIEEARQLITAGMIAELITDIRQISASILAFAERQDHTDRSVAELHSLRRRNGVIAAAALGLTIVLALVVIVGGILLTGIARDNQHNGRLLVECTTPDPLPGTAVDAADRVHECYDRAQENQARAVGAITNTLVQTGICARLQSTESAIRSCVTGTTTTLP